MLGESYGPEKADLRQAAKTAKKNERLKGREWVWAELWGSWAALRRLRSNRKRDEKWVAARNP